MTRLPCTAWTATQSHGTQLSTIRALTQLSAPRLRIARVDEHKRADRDFWPADFGMSQQRELVVGAGYNSIAQMNSLGFDEAERELHRAERAAVMRRHAEAADRVVMLGRSP